MPRVSFLLPMLAFVVLPSAHLAAAEPTPEQRRAIEAVIEDYLVRNPEVVERALTALEARREAEERRAVQAEIRRNRRELFDSRDIPVGGNPKGDVTVVEFFDYRCGVCRRVHPIVTRLLEDDRGVRFVYKEWPILGPESVYAARAALAARAQGKYAAFHDALMGGGRLSEAVVLQKAARIGLDVERLRRDMEAPEISRVIARTAEIAKALRLDGTPSFLVGDRLLRGGRDLETMKRLVAEARAAAN